MGIILLLIRGQTDNPSFLLPSVSISLHSYLRDVINWAFEASCSLCEDRRQVWSSEAHTSCPHCSKTSRMSQLPQVPCQQHLNEPITKHHRKPSSPLRNMTVCWSPWKRTSCFCRFYKNMDAAPLLSQSLSLARCSSSGTLPPQALPRRPSVSLAVHFSADAKRKRAAFICCLSI